MDELTNYTLSKYFEILEKYLVFSKINQIKIKIIAIISLFINYTNRGLLYF